MRLEPNKTVYTVKTLNRELRSLLESSYRSIWVEGEISSLATPASGHIYFSLKDENSIIRCAFFRNRRSRSGPAPKEGMKVLLSGQISYYEPRGDLQFIVSYMEESGEGALRRTFEMLKQKLSSEGLFEQQLKQELPAHPGTIGIITSGTGAALHDILVTLKRRYPVTSVIVYPTLVQGVDAPKSIVEAIDIAENRYDADVLILARGGGSLEDLQAFNDEEVARRIFRCVIPVVSGIGHEVDFTICDFVADMRAPTPTAAAEIVTPDIRHIKESFSLHETKLYENITKYIREFQQTVDYSTSKLTHPRQKLANYRSMYNSLVKQLIIYNQLYTGMLNNLLKNRLNVVSTHSPHARIQFLRHCLTSSRQSLTVNIDSQLKNRQHSLIQGKGKILVMSPKHTLDRGYAIVQNFSDTVITDPRNTNQGESLRIRVAKGQINVVVHEK